MPGSARSASGDELLYELLDAHADTIELVARCATSVEWSLHCDYLRDLQRLTREELARREVTASALHAGD